VCVRHPGGGLQRSHPQPEVGSDGHRDRVLGAVAGLGRSPQLCEAAVSLLTRPGATTRPSSSTAARS
jgi:hypothetical protein